MSIKENIKNLKKEIPDSIKLIGVSKTRDIEEIKEAYECGIRDFGENKVQELINKYDYFNSDVNWHLIGHLQRNKVKYIVGKVKLIHSVDSIKLLDEIEKEYGKSNKIAEILIQVNIGREESKTGIFKENIEELIIYCEGLKNIKVKGIMAIIPKGNEESCRLYFKEMKTLFDLFKGKQYKNVSMDYLSMGMTGDYKIAISEGSNMVRIGEGIFGKRINK